jgi:CRISPR-associated protein Cas2
MFYVVSYDIPESKRRNQVRAVLKNYGTRVQYSVFECHLERDQLSELRARLAAVIVEEEDCVRYYRLCQDCLDQTIVVGRRPLTSEPDYWIV